ncbi:MAG: hypothetical protein LBC99_11100 [Spirochaetota bacterium]|jgi:hypothetical protein|nr:hypothetical protein [Spirochaetota bacterium]
MKSKKILWALCIMVVSLPLLAGGPPKTFVPAGGKNATSGYNPSASILIRPGLSYDKAFAAVAAVCSRHAALDMIQKDSGYMRTSWQHAWNKKNKPDGKYRIRIICTVHMDGSAVEVKVEAGVLENKKKDRWIPGSDSEALKAILNEINDAVGVTGV